MVKILLGMKNFSLISQMVTPEYSQTYLNNLQVSIHIEHVQGYGINNSFL
jgi:hypothetical protein